MTIYRKLFCIVSIATIISGIVFTPGVAKAETTLTVYTQAVDGPPASPASLGPATNTLSSDFGSPGARYVQETNLFSRSSLTGNPVGNVTVACIELINVFDAECMATFTFNKTDSITLAGFYTEGDQQPPLCISVNYIAISGGTGKYHGAQGQVKVTHTPVFQPSDNVSQCQHEIHDYRYDISLANQNM
jgi:hypothetical protein